MSEQSEFYRKAAEALHLVGTLAAMLHLDIDTTTPKQVEAAVVARLRQAIVDAELARECPQLKHAITNLKTTLTAQKDVMLAIRKTCPADPDINAAWEAAWNRLEEAVK